MFGIAIFLAAAAELFAAWEVARGGGSPESAAALIALSLSLIAVAVAVSGQRILPPRRRRHKGGPLARAEKRGRRPGGEK